MKQLQAVVLLGVLAAHPAMAEPTALVKLKSAKEGMLQPRVVAYGTVAPDPNHLTTVALPRDGIITAVSVRRGQLVQVGDPIAAVETAPSAAAGYAQAKSALAFARKDLSHMKALYAQRLATKSQLAAAEKASADARAQFEAQKKIGASRTTEILRANAPGIVTACKVSPGDRVAANTVIASIATQDRLLLDLGLEPRDALRTPIGAVVTLRAPQDPEIKFFGQIQSVDRMMDDETRLVNAVVSIPPDVTPQLILGMVLEAAISLPGQAGILVPRSALMTDQQGTYVYVVGADVAKRRSVHIALETDRKALISRGVAADERVVVDGNAGLEDGMHIRVH